MTERKSGTKAGLLAAAVVVVAVMVALPMGSAQIGERTLDTGDYATASGSSSFCWRGYTFTVAHPTVVTALFGGYQTSFFGGGGTWHVGLYTAPALDMSGQSATDLLATGSYEGDERFERVEVEQQVLLPGQVYLLAQGREVGSGSHYRLTSDIDVSRLTTTETHILEWGPDDGRAFTFGCTGDPNEPLDNTASSFTSSIRPHLGLDDTWLQI